MYRIEKERDEGGIVTFRAFDYRTGRHIEIEMPGPEFVAAFLRHVLPARLHRYRTAGIFAPPGRTARLDLCRQFLGEPTAEQVAQASEHSLLNPFAGEADEEQEGSYVPCPVCRQRTSLRFNIAASILGELLPVAAAVVALLGRHGSLALTTAIGIVARARCHDRPLLRALLPGQFASHADLLLITETLVRDRLRRQPQMPASERGPP